MIAEELKRIMFSRHKENILMWNASLSGMVVREKNNNAVLPTLLWMTQKKHKEIIADTTYNPDEFMLKIYHVLIREEKKKKP